MKKKIKLPINRPLIPSIKKPSDGLPVKKNPVVAIRTNVAEEKDDCALCTFHPYYGVELVFILHYADKSIETVCYNCGKRVAEETGLKLPMTLFEIEYIEGAEDRKIIRKEFIKMERECDN